jgi:hypothetical protein
MAAGLGEATRGPVEKSPLRPTCSARRPVENACPLHPRLGAGRRSARCNPDIRWAKRRREPGRAGSLKWPPSPVRCVVQHSNLALGHGPELRSPAPLEAHHEKNGRERLHASTALACTRLLLQKTVRLSCSIHGCRYTIFLLLFFLFENIRILMCSKHDENTIKKNSDRCRAVVLYESSCLFED